VSTSFLKHLAARGARIAERPEAPEFDAPLTFGDVPAEYRAGLEGACLLDATDRGRLRVTGTQAPDFLHRLLSINVRGLEVGAANRNLLLSAKGKVLFDFDLCREQESIVLSTPPGQARPLLEALDVYLFAEDVRIEDESGDHRPLEIGGPSAASVLAELFPGHGPLPAHSTIELPWNAIAVKVSSLPVAGAPGFRLDAGSEAAGLWQALEAAGATPVGLVARDMLRVERGAALFGIDVDENVYPQEARMEEAFSLDKGCYIGQEVVAKIDTYGGLNKRLEALSVDSDEPVARGTKLLLEDRGEARELGMVTSWVYSFALDTGVVLAYVKRKHQQPGTTFRLGNSGAKGKIVDWPIRCSPTT
jgi:folate-binding protein YgfZ